MWKTITWENSGKLVKRIVWKKRGKEYCEKSVEKQCGKQYCEKSVKNMWKTITWENCGKLWKNCEKTSVEKYVEKNSMGKVWKIIIHGKSVEKL